MNRRELLIGAAAAAGGLAFTGRAEAGHTYTSTTVASNSELYVPRGKHNVSGAPIRQLQGSRIRGEGTAGGSGWGSVLQPLSGYTGSGIKVLASSGDVNACHWWQTQGVTLSRFAGHGMEVYGPNEDAKIERVGAYECGGDGFHIRNRMAGFKGLEDCTAHGCTGWGLNFEGVTSTVVVKSFSGDRNKKGLVRISGLNWAEFLFDGLKHEYDTVTAQAGQPPVTIDCGAGRNVHVTILAAHLMGYSAAPPPAAIRIVSGNVFLRVIGRIGYFQNWLVDVPRGVSLPLTGQAEYVYNTAS